MSFSIPISGGESGSPAGRAFPRIFCPDKAMTALDSDSTVPALVSSLLVEQVLREILLAGAYTVSRARGIGETGVDVLAEKQGVRYHIESISHKSSPPMRSRDFLEAFFRAVSRLDDGAHHCVIAVPHLTARGLPDRARRYRVAWRRIAESFPELEVWIVNTDSRTVDRTTWIQWLQDPS